MILYEKFEHFYAYINEWIKRENKQNIIVEIKF